MNDPRTLATTYLQGWKDKDFDAMASTLADDATFRGPLGQADGIEECLDGVRGLAEIITDVKIIAMVADDTDVMTFYELHTRVAPPVPTVNWSHVENGRIATIRAVFDPRELLAAG